MKRLISSAFIAWLLLGASAMPVQSQSTATPHSVFVFVMRTKGHQKYSKAEVFQSVVDDVLGYLKEKKVAQAVDEFGGRTHSEDEMPIQSVLNIAKDTGATSVLYLIVDRPVTKWVKVVTRAYDMNGNLLWEEKAESGGGMSGAHGLRVTLDRLHEALDKHIGKDGLPVQQGNPNAAAGQ